MDVHSASDDDDDVHKKSRDVVVPRFACIRVRVCVCVCHTQTQSDCENNQQHKAGPYTIPCVALPKEGETTTS